jgi:hypothetical protein
MANQFTTVTNQGFISRLMGSIVGFFVGPILVIGAVVLLSWNEGRAVHALNELSDASRSPVEADATAVSPANEGKLVHVVGPATASAGIDDPDVGAKFTGQVAVVRKAEMYEWKETSHSTTHDKLGGGTETVTTYTYDKVWADQAIDSSQFKQPEGHTNPAMPITGATLAASDAKLGGFTLDVGTVKLLALASPLSPDAPSGWTASAGALYKGQPGAPAIGDERLSYTGLANGSTISVLAAQSHGGFGPYVTKNGYQVEMARLGNQAAAAMLAEQKKTEGAITWVLRGFGFVAMFLGFAMFFGPLSTFMAVVPLLGSIARGAAGLAAFVLAIPLTLVVIAIAWIAFRPLLGIGLLVAAAALLYGLGRLHRSRHPAPAIQAAA